MLFCTLVRMFGRNLNLRLLNCSGSQLCLLNGNNKAENALLKTSQIFVFLYILSLLFFARLVGIEGLRDKTCGGVSSGG